MNTPGNPGDQQHAPQSPEGKYPVEQLHGRLCAVLASEGTTRTEDLPDGLYYDFESGGAKWQLNNHLDNNNLQGDTSKPPFRDLLESSKSFLTIESAPDEPGTNSYIIIKQSDVAPRGFLDTMILKPAIATYKESRLPSEVKELPDWLVIHANTDKSHFASQRFRIVDRPSEIDALMKPVHLKEAS